MVLGLLLMRPASEPCSLCDRYHKNLCRKCRNDCQGRVVQQLCNRNVHHWYVECDDCDGRSDFISEQGAGFAQCVYWEDIEIVDNRCQSCLGQGCPDCEYNPCEVKHCTTPHNLVQTHHWAMKKYWKRDADLWPTSRLCKFHHDEWHKVMRNDNT